MGLRQILTFPDERLKIRCEPVEELNDGIQELIDDMAETMYSAPGIGLAAPQVGEQCRVIVFDVGTRDEPRKPMALINPEIVECEGEIVSEEGCLSVLDYNSEVKRSARVWVRGLDRDGRRLEIEAEELLAIVLQHEIDHLDGILFIDRISKLKKSLYVKRLKKIEKSEA